MAARRGARRASGGGSNQGVGSFVGTAGDEGTAPISLGVTWMGDSDGGNASGGLELSEGAIVSIARACVEVRKQLSGLPLV